MVGLTASFACPAEKPRDKAQQRNYGRVAKEYDDQSNGVNGPTCQIDCNPATIEDIWRLLHGPLRPTNRATYEPCAYAPCDTKTVRLQPGETGVVNPCGGSAEVFGIHAVDEVPKLVEHFVRILGLGI